MTLFYKKPNHLKIISEATSNYQNTVLQPNCKNTVIENKKARLSYKHNFNFFKLKQNLNTTHMSNSLPNCISRLVTNRSQKPNFKTNNGFLKNLVATFALVFLLLGANTNVNAQSNTNCFVPYNPTPASVWGVEEKFKGNAVVWSGATPTAADLDGCCLPV